MNKTRTTRIVALGAAVLAGVTALAPGAGAGARQQDPTDVERAVAAAFEGDVLELRVVKLDVGGLREGLLGGRAEIILADPANDVREVATTSERVELLGKGVNVGTLRHRGGQVERVRLGRTQDFRLGDCATGKPATGQCGALSILDREATMVSGMVIDPELGTSFVEPVEMILGRNPELANLHVVYNLANTRPTDIADSDSDSDVATADDHTGFAGSSIYKSTRIVLDSDTSFYQADPATVFSRQRAIFNVMDTLYSVVEPLSSDATETVRWGLDLSIKGQESWVSGGPDTSGGSALIADLVDPGYFLINPVNNQELHHFFVGKSVPGLLGKAAGIGSTAGFGGAPGRNHAFSVATTGMSLKSKWVVMAHEQGHVIGGHHGLGEAGGCSKFLGLWSICGPSIMPAGGVASADARVARFSDANDNRIADVLDAVL